MPSGISADLDEKAHDTDPGFLRHCGAVPQGMRGLARISSP